MRAGSAIVGVSDHGGWALFVTVSGEAAVLDRRRLDLIDDALPSIPHHHEAQMLPLEEGVALVERVRASAQRYAAAALDVLQAAIPTLEGIALRERQPLPPTTAERIQDARARNVADWVMYREALAEAAVARDWHLHWVDPKTALSAAGNRTDLRKTIGAPWSNDHRLAMALALAAFAG